MGQMQAGRTSEEAPSPAPLRGPEDGVGRTPPELPRRLQWQRGPAVRGSWISGSSTRFELPRKSRHRCELLGENPALTAEKRGAQRPREARKCGRPTRRGGGV